MKTTKTKTPPSFDAGVTKLGMSLGFRVKITPAPELLAAREPKLFRDISTEDLYSRLQDFRGRWKPGMKVSNTITQMREELAHRAGQPEGTLWGNFGFLDEPKPTAFRHLFAG